MIGTNGMKYFAKRLGLMCPLLACLTCLALCFLAPLGMAQDGTPRTFVAEVKIIGARTVSEDKIRVILHTKPGMEFSKSTVLGDVNRLADTHLFKYIRPVRTEPTGDGRVNVIFEVQEHTNIVREVKYLHAKHVNVKELEGLTRVQRGMPLDKTLNQLACYQILDHLQKQGYYFANVSLLEGHDERHDRVVFNITEGPKVRIGAIHFTGNHELATDARLLTQVDSRKALLGVLGGSFQPGMVEQDRIKLKEYYHANGYLKADVSRELRFSDDFLFVEITFHIHEGVRYRVQDVSVEGSNREQLRGILTVKKGDFYNDGVVETDTKNLQAFRGWRGYPDQVTKHVTEIPDNPDVVRVQYVVEEKPQSYVGEVIIVGNNVTQDRVIRSMLGLYPGQILRYPELKLAESNLARLGIFEMNPELGQRPSVTAIESPGPFKDVLVKVQETRTGTFMLGAGVNSNSGLVGTIALNERNFDLFKFPTSFADFIDGKAFRGAGQELRIEAMPGTQIQRYTISVREPMLFDQPYSLLGSAYYRDRIFNEYTEGRYGARFNLGHQFTKQIGASVGIRIENINVSNLTAGVPADYTSVQGNHFLAAPSVTVSYDTRDSYLRPSEGGKMEFTYEQAFGSFIFPIVNVEGSRYFTLWQRPDGSGKHTVSIRSQASFAGDNAPVYERFFGGGYGSIRGFQFRGVGPSENGFMTGGTFMFLNSVEYQIPIRANDALYAVAFVDSGTVESKIGIHDYRVSAGFGLRISLPMMGPVPIALDFGFPIVKTASDIGQLFSFSLGFAR